MSTEIIPLAVVAFAALAQTFLLLKARREARYWRDKYLGAPRA